MGDPRTILARKRPEYLVFSFFFFNLFFLLFSMGNELHLHVFIFFPPFVLLGCKYLDIVLNATQQGLIVNPFQEQ